jgi:hypothetical protein
MPWCEGAASHYTDEPRRREQARHSMRVNDQYLVTSRRENGYAYEVAVDDYRQTSVLSWSGDPSRRVAPAGAPLAAGGGQLEAAKQPGVSLKRPNDRPRQAWHHRGHRAAARAALKTSPQLWMRLQADWDLHQAMQREGRTG